MAEKQTGTSCLASFVIAVYSANSKALRGRKVRLVVHFSETLAYKTSIYLWTRIQYSFFDNVLNFEKHAEGISFLGLLLIGHGSLTLAHGFVLIHGSIDRYIGKKQHVHCLFLH